MFGTSLLRRFLRWHAINDMKRLLQTEHEQVAERERTRVRVVSESIRMKQVLATVPDPIHVKAVTCLRMAQPRPWKDSSRDDCMRLLVGGFAYMFRGLTLVKVHRRWTCSTLPEWTAASNCGIFVPCRTWGSYQSSRCAVAF